MRPEAPMFQLFLACSPDDAIDCSAGFDLRDDGLCYEIPVEDTDPVDTDVPEAEPATVEDVLDALPACEGGYDDGRIDIEAGCADGACAGMTYDDINEALAEEGDCSSYYVDFDGYAYGYSMCAWSNGVSTDFADDDQDGVPDAGDRAYSIALDLPYDGGTAEGLSLDSHPRCFVDVLGDPSSASFAMDEDGEWLVRSIAYTDLGLYVYDSYDKVGDYVPDGRVDGMTLYGSF
jgi:hypothetical protein